MRNPSSRIAVPTSSHLACDFNATHLQSFLRHAPAMSRPRLLRRAPECGSSIVNGCTCIFAPCLRSQRHPSSVVLCCVIITSLTVLTQQKQCISTFRGSLKKYTDASVAAHYHLTPTECVANVPVLLKQMSYMYTIMFGVSFFNLYWFMASLTLNMPQTPAEWQVYIPLQPALCK